jgi:hypothetical protein
MLVSIQALCRITGGAERRWKLGESDIVHRRGKEQLTPKQRFRQLEPS